MDYTTAIEKINATRDGNTKVAIEYMSCDLKRKTGGVLKHTIGVRTHAGHDVMEHGTVVILDDSGEYHTIHTALIMKLNNEFVD